MNISKLTYHNYTLISAPKIDSDLLWNLSALFIVLAVLYFIGIFFYRNKISSNSKKVRDHKRELSPMISEFLFLEEDASKDEKSNYIALKIEIRQLLKDNFNRKILSEILLDLRKDLSGEAQQSLLKLYQDLGLDKDAYAKLNGWRWQIISKGILELTQMEVVDAYGFITKFINDKRSTIRKQAEIATVTLKHDGINYFLDTTKYKISEWQQLKLLDVIRNKKDFQPPRFKALLTSNNKYVVLFALRLIKYYNQNDADDSVIELVKHKNNQIKEEAVACIKEFNMTNALETLKLVFWNCSINVKIAILDAIAQIGSEADIEFLNLIDKKELNFSVKSKALSSINAISPESIMPSKGILEESRYVMPEDITEAVAKLHARKHEDLSGELDPEFNDDALPEELLAEETVLHDLENVVVDIDTIHIADAEDILDLRLAEEIVILPESEEANSLYNIEVIIEEEVSLNEVNENDFESIEWTERHLDFLPIIISEEVNEQEENTLDKEKSSFFEAFNIKELAFLPLVIENELDSLDTQNEETVKEKVDLHDIIVAYDEVINNSPEEKKEDSSIELEFNFEALDGLNKIELQDQSNTDSKVDYKRYCTKEILEITVVGEEVLKRSIEQEILEFEVVEPQILAPESESEPSIEVNAASEQQELKEIELPIENEQILQKIIDDLLADDKPQEKAKDLKVDENYINPDWALDESDLDFTPVSFERKEQLPSYIEVNKIEDLIEYEEMGIPKAIFGDVEFEASTRNLLHELEEMGDEREVPFLKELLVDKKYASFNERITNLIDTFNKCENKEKIENQLPFFSVFKDLFRTCDTEAKLILLDEVVAVGDEKDLDFLESLKDDDAIAVREKAFVVLKELKTKLFGDEVENSNTPDIKRTESSGFFNPNEGEENRISNDPADIFNLNFDLTFGLDSVKNEQDPCQNARQYGSFFGSICSFSNKIIERLYG